MTAKVWNTAFDLLMINEGGYVNDPKDSGGETKYGISKKAYPYVDIPNLTIEQAKEIYKKDYWDRCKCDYLPDCLSVAVFDFAVNSGTDRAIKYLQMAITGITVDGIIGNQTIGAANRVPIRKVLKQYMDYRTDFIYRWAQNPKNKKFEQVIIKRIEKVRKFCEELI
jgi:lysozyme family protein